MIKKPDSYPCNFRNDILKEEEKKMIIKYKVDKDAGVIVASLGNRNDWRSDILEYVSTTMIRGCADLYADEVEKLVTNEVSNINSIVGIARKHPDDTWNEEIGKEVAAGKLMRKYNRCINRILNKALLELQKRYLFTEVIIKKAVREIH